MSDFFTKSLADSDPALAAAIDAELGRQRDEIELIASENIVSAAVLEAQGSIMTNKYAEGYPGRCSTAHSPTSSRTRAAKQTKVSLPRCCNPATPFWV